MTTQANISAKYTDMKLLGYCYATTKWNQLNLQQILDRVHGKYWVDTVRCAE